MICLSVLTYAAPSYAFPYGMDIYLDREAHLLVIMEDRWKMSIAYSNIAIMKPLSFFKEAVSYIEGAAIFRL